MSVLIVEVDGRTLRLEEMRTYRIGRAIEADVVLAAGSVSRQHAELRPVRGGCCSPTPAASSAPSPTAVGSASSR